MSKKGSLSEVQAHDDSIDPELIDDEKGGPWAALPWDPKDIRITTRNFSLREIYLQITEGDLDLAPDFQRSFVWKNAQQVRLIESILLGIPLPAFYFNQEKLGSNQVVDGVQRLTTLKHFMSDELVLVEGELEYLKSLKGLTYSSLDPATKKRFASTQIVVHIIEPQTPDEVKYDIFSRVNTGGSPLTAQEIRHCMSKELSRDFLRRLVESSYFDVATGRKFWAKDAAGKTVRNNARMTDREVALRFCAFYSQSLEEYAKSVSLDAFLLRFTRVIDRQSETGREVNLEHLENAFRQSMINCHAILGVYAFRRCSAAGTRGPFNRAIFESQAIALADYRLETLLPHKEKVRDALLELFQHSEYDSSVRFGTGAPLKVARRINLARNAVEAVLN